MKFKPYAEYKTVSNCWWLSQLPINWGLFLGKRFFIRRKELNSGMKCENRLSLTMNGVLRRSLDDLDGLQASEYETYQQFEEGDLVFKLIDLQNIKTSRVGLVPEAGIMSPAYIRLCRDNDRLIARFSYWYYTDLYNQNVFNQLGGGVRQTLGSDELLTIPIPEPSVPEQQSICDYIDRETFKLSALIAKQERLIELLQEKRQTMISLAVTKGLDPSVPMKDSGIEWLGKVPEHWEAQRVKTISIFTTSGPRGWSDRIGDEGGLFIQSGDLNDSLKVEFHRAKRVHVENDAEAERTHLMEGDVILCITGAKTGNVAVCSTIPEASYINQHLCLIRPNSKMLSKYLGLFLKSNFGQAYFYISQYGLKQGLSLENVREAPVMSPPTEEQRRIVDYLENATASIDALIAKSRRNIELIREHRTALISAAVTGKIDVREAA